MNLIKKIGLGSLILASTTLMGNQLNNQEDNPIRKLKESYESVNKLNQNCNYSSNREFRDLGKGYVMENKERNSKEDPFYILKLIDSLKKNKCSLKNNGNRILLNGNLSSIVSEKTLREIDNIKRDKFISEEEIYNVYNNYLKESFSNYASKTLGENKKNIIFTKEGYAYKKSSEESLDFLKEIYSKAFNLKESDVYFLISKKDKVITPEEIKNNAEKLHSLLFE